MEQQEDVRLTDDQLKLLLSQAFPIAQKPIQDCTELELSKLVAVVSNTRFFQRNLDSQINFDDFMEKIKYQIGYETYPKGTVLFHDGHYSNKMSIIIKGVAAKYHQRPLKEVEKEIVEKTKQMKREREEEESHKKTTIIETSGQMSLSQIDPQTPSKLYRSSTLASKRKQKAPVGPPKFESEPKSSQKKFGLMLSLNSIESESEILKEEDEFDSEISIPAIGGDTYRSKGNNAGRSTEFSMKAANGKDDRKGKRKDVKPLNKRPGLDEDLIVELEEAAETEDELEMESQRQKAEMKKIKDLVDRENDIEMFNEMLQNMPQVMMKYFIGDTLKMKRLREYNPGQHFGESFIKANKPKENLLVAVEEIHLLTITREDYAKAMSQLHEKVKEKTEFFAKVFPSLAADENLKTFAYYFKEKAYKKNEKIFSEDDATDGLFLLYTGNVRLFKKTLGPVKPKVSYADSLLNANSHRSPRKDFPVTSVIEGQFFGEELLLREPKRQLTATSKTSGTKVYWLEAWLYLRIKVVFSKIVDQLKNQAKEKVDWRQARIEERLENLATMEQVKHSYEKLHLMDNKEKTHGNEIPGLSLGRISSMPDSPTHGENATTHAATERRSYVPNQKGVRNPSYDGVVQEGGVLKNLEVYKERFYRKTYENKVTANVTFLKKNDAERAKLNPSATDNRDHEIIIPIKTHKKKALSISTNPPVHLPPLNIAPTLVFPATSKALVTPKLPSKEGIEIFSFPNDGTLQNLDTHPNLLVTQPNQVSDYGIKVIKDNVLQFLTPRYEDGGNESVLRNKDGSLSVVSGRSKLRGVLKTLDQIPDLSEALQGLKMPSKLLLSSIKETPKTTRLKDMRKVHVIRGHFKSTEVSPNRVELGSLSARQMQVIKTKKSKF